MNVRAAGQVAVVVPVHRNGATLPALVDRLAAALPGPWVLRLVIDACPEDSAEVAATLAAVDPRVRVTLLVDNVGQHRALVAGLSAEPDAAAWVCLDADLQDPPEAVPALVDQLVRQGGGAVFAGRAGSYESPSRRVTGIGHRWVVAALTGLPARAGAFLAMDRGTRDAVVRAVTQGAPSVVAAVATAPGPHTSTDVPRAARPTGRSSWSTRARVLQSLRTLRWAARHRFARST